MENLDFIETVSYSVLIIGVLLDQITTKIGLNRFNLYEANIIAKNLMGLGVWSYFDITICLIFIVFSYKAYRIILKRENKLMFIFPFLAGTIRLFVGIWNITFF